MGFHLVTGQTHVGSDRVLVESDAIFLIGRPVVKRCENQSPVVLPAPRPLRRRVETNTGANRFADRFEWGAAEIQNSLTVGAHRFPDQVQRGGGAVEVDDKRGKMKFLFEFRDGNRFRVHRDFHWFRQL